MGVAKDAKKTLIVKEIAAKHRVSKAFVYMVVAGDKENEDILDDFFELKEGIDAEIEKIQNNPLMASVKELIPFN